VRRCVLAVLLVSVGACAGRGDGAYAEQPPARAAADEVAGRRCATLTRPPTPRSLDEVTRPGTRWAVATWGNRAVPTDSVELSVRYGSEGRLDWVRTTRGNVSPERVSELERIVLGGISDSGPAEWGFRVRLVGAQVQAVLPSVVCPPGRLPMAGRRPPPAGTAAELAEARQVLGRPIELEVSLNEEGSVVDIRVARSSGSHFMDREAMDRALAIRYLPSLHDDMGIPSVIPLTFTVRLVRRRVPRGAAPEVVG
jgi:TonB family protein